MSANSIPPLTPRGKYLAWCAAHAPTFSANATNIGLTTVKTTAYGNLIKAAQSAIEVMDAQKTAYHNSVVAAATAMRNLSKGTNGTSDLVATVRAFAESSADPSTVYNLAEIDPPAPPSPLPAPNAPTDIAVNIDTVTGAIVLNWKASQPGTGTIYIVKRRVNSTGPGGWQYIGSAGSDKTFTDNTFAPGPDSVQYSIQAQRSNKFSDATAVVVNFGTSGGEFNVTNVKMAA